MKRVCVFCGSSSGLRPEYAEAARGVGAALARRGLTLVYGGGNVGLMGEVADAALAAGGEVIGIIPEALVRWEVAHQGLTELRVVADMHARKAAMADLADAFIMLPGGYGTLEEFCEILTWSQLTIHQKPCGLVNVRGYYTHFLQLLDHAVAEGFVRPAHRDLVLVEETPDALLDRLDRFQSVTADKWTGRAWASE
jgi:uncharacterized protein (TIGR00730 family)